MDTIWLRRYLNLRTLALLVLYAVLAAASYYGAYLLRFDFSIPANHFFDLKLTLGWVVLLKLVLLLVFGQVDCILAYFRLPDASRLFFALLSSSLILAYLWYAYDGEGLPPRGVIVTDLQLSFLLFVGFRLFMRVRASRNLADWLVRSGADSVVIVGAGEVGAGLCAELLHKPSFGMRPIAFLDDNRRKVGRFVHGVPIVDTVDQLPRVVERFKPSKAVIAMPSASMKRVGEVAGLAGECGLMVETVPSLTDLVSGRARATQLRPIELEDLLGREAVDLDSQEIRAMLAGRRVLVTGAGGSIGSELAGQILDYGPSRLVLLDQVEVAVFGLRHGLLRGRTGADTATRVADVGDGRRMAAILREEGPEVVFHAAAHKHVGLMEDQPAEALQNNFLATVRFARLASEAGVDRFILVSTDKAINPTSVMGASKRLAELGVQAVQRTPGNRTRFMAVRFGNVLGSSGSVVPIFRRQIAEGGPVTVTDPEVTRFFMTVSEAAGLVLQSATLGSGGEIFVLDMGLSVKIVDVARQMIELSGLEPGKDIEIVFTGLRPGEKLYEEVQHVSEELRPTSHPRVLRFVAGDPAKFDLEAVVAEFEGALDEDVDALKKRIRSHVPEYRPFLGESGE
jgi:FlaA1/EpsC-like NDP-sugar epimerase